MARKKATSTIPLIKHGGFFNEDCVYCSRIESISWVIMTILVIVGVLFFILSDGKNGVSYSVVLLVAYILSFLTRKWWQKLSVQSHGLYFDRIGNQGWHKSRRTIRGKTDDKD